ncbi:hypothetical protein [Nocardioides ungokensis]|uniref:hypothetical protein n=1 Tax=Nocardioides ungokensis TaxID=1643322 RepID=UPI001C60F13C|nr:hypothetical protein [Nocardioides ungokensis]
MQIRDIANAVAERFDVPVTFAEGAAPDKRDYRVDFGKVTSLLPGFRPSWTVPCRDRRAGCGHGAQRPGGRRLRGARFVRLERINQLRSQGLLDDLLFMKS